MSFALLLIGIVLLVAAVRGTQDQLVFLLKADFTGPANFGYWVVVLLVLGAIGYIERLKPLSDGLLVLLILVLFLTRGRPGAAGGGFFEKFAAALKTTQAASVAPGPVHFSSTGAFILPSDPRLNPLTFP